MASGLVSNRFVGAAFAREHRVLGFDCLVRTSCRRDSDELAEKLPAEHAVVFQALVTAFELGYVLAGAFLSGAPRRHRIEIKASEEIGPEIAHSRSVSPILQK